MLRRFGLKWFLVVWFACVFQGMQAATVIRLGTITQITGPQGIDLEGEILYAVNFSPDDPVRTVRGVGFLPDRQPIPGATFIGPQQVIGWQTKPEFGSTADANQFEEIMHDIRWANAGSNERLRATFRVNAGEEHKIQILISGNTAENRRWDIRVNGQEAVDEITSLGRSPSQSYALNRSTLYTYQFTPSTTNIVIEMGNLFGGNDGGDRNAIWQALIVERVFIPPTPDDLSLTPSAFFANQTNTLGLLKAVDRKSAATHQFTFVAGAGDTDNSKFEIAGNELRPNIDFRAYPSGTLFSIRVRAVDTDDPLRFIDKSLTVQIVESHPPSSIRLDAASINRSAQAGALVANMIVMDEDVFDRHTLQLVDGVGNEENALFAIDGQQLRLASAIPAGLSQVRIRLRAIDLAERSVEATFVLPVAAPQVQLSELVGGFTETADETIDAEDKIEIHNKLAQWVDLAGWHLTDQEDNLSRWQFPRRELAPNGYLVVVADGRGTAPEGSTNVHTSFQLDASGEWVGLIDPDGTIASELRVPEFYPNVAYGVGVDGRFGYLLRPTLGGPNGLVADFGASEVVFSKKHGFYPQSFSLELSATVVGSIIRYTLDGTAPTATTGLVYSNPITISPATTAATRGSRIIRAIAVNARAAYTPVKTQTYLFINGNSGPAVDGVVTQSRFVPSIRTNSVYGPLLDDALNALPVMSVVLFPRTGPTDTELPGSIEFFDPENLEEGFQIDCGIHRTGTSSLASPKLSMAAKFRSKYGRSRLNYPFFARGSLAPQGAAGEFKELRLRSHSHDTFYWLATRENPPVPYGNPPVTRSGDAQLMRNLWIDEMQLLMGQPGKRGRQVHLYLNGAYHGIYHIHEHADEDFMASYYPGDSEDFHFSGAGVSGSEHDGGGSWRDTWAALKASLGNYREAQRWVDVTNLCDYMVLSFYAGNDWDWSTQHNWSAAGPNAPDRGGWKFFQQDSDVSLQDVNADCTDQDAPDGIFTALMRHADFRVLFRDRVYKHCFNGGVLTRAAEVYDTRMNEILTAVIAETARWQPGSSVSPFPWDRDQEWTNEWRYFRNTFFPLRTSRLIPQLRRHAGWWPSDPPTLNRYSGTVPAGFELSLTSSIGTIYYTTDGSDPRLPGGVVNSRAFRANTGASETTVVPMGANWRFLDNGTDPGTAWTNRFFDDSNWRSGPTEIGYGDGGEATVANFVDTDPVAVGIQKNLTTYFRKTFDLPGLAGIKSVIMRLVRDDGAVIYLNGREVWRVNMPAGAITSRTAASAGIAGTDETTPVELTLSPGDLSLQPTENVLAVEIHQQTADSSDISFNFEMIVTGAGTNSPAIINSPTLVKARVLSGGDWSALVEAYLVPDNVPAASASNLVISEIQYHPLDENENEFIEFLNTSTQPLDLSDVTLSEAITYRFPKATALGPGDRIVVAKDLALFSARYQTNSSPYVRDVRVVGPWIGSLSNDGEGIAVSSPTGALLFVASYGVLGEWPGRADGKGSSLELINPARVPLDPNAKSAWLADPLNWRPSSEFHGSPGVAGIGPDNRVTVNEILTSPLPPETDTIELKNLTDRELDLTGWFLSDNSANYRKYHFPPASRIGPGSYLVLREEDFNNTNNPAALVRFALESSGEDLYLIEADTNRALLRFVDRIEFGALSNAVCFGRWPDGTGPLLWLSAPTFGSTNSLPLAGYQAWSLATFDDDMPGELRQMSADPDADGLSNFAEYAFAFSPLRRSDPPLSIVSLQGGQTFGFSYRKRTSATDLTYHVELSSDFVNWDRSGGQIEILTETPRPDGSSLVLGRIRPAATNSTPPFHFLRILVSP